MYETSDVPFTVEEVVHILKIRTQVKLLFFQLCNLGMEMCTCSTILEGQNANMIGDLTNAHGFIRVNRKFQEKMLFL